MHLITNYNNTMQLDFEESVSELQNGGLQGIAKLFVQKCAIYLYSSYTKKVSNQIYSTLNL